MNRIFPNDLHFGAISAPEVVKPHFPQQHSHRRITLCSAPAGAGKTYALCRLALQMSLSGESVVFVQPTKELIGDTIKQMRDINEREEIHPNVFIKRIDGSVTRQVVKSAMSYLKSADAAQGEILFLTQEGFMGLPYFHRPDRWNLIMDEAPQAHNSVSLEFPYTHSHLTDLLKAEPFGENWVRLSISDVAGSARFSKMMKSDKSIRAFEDAADLLQSKHWDTYALAESYKKFLSGNNSNSFSPDLYATLKPTIFSGFKSVRIAGARLEDSLLVILWKSQGIQFTEELLSGLKYHFHPNGDLVTIYYGSELHWSKTLRKNHPEELWIPLLSEIERLSNGSEFLYAANKDQDFLFPDQGINAIRLPNMPHGLNTFMDINMIAFLSALNLKSGHRGFLNSLGVSDFEIVCDTYYSKIYQAIMRGGIRKPDNTEQQIVVVPDKGSAEWLQHIFPGSKLESFGLQIPGKIKGSVGRKKKFANGAERVAAYRKQQKELIIDHMAQFDYLTKEMPQIIENELLHSNASCNEIPYNNINYITRFHGSIWDKLNAPKASGFLIADNPDQFITKLREYHQRHFANKHDNNLLCAGFPVEIDKGRKLENLFIANGIFLDNDAGELTPDEFANFLPDTKMVIYNTHSSTRQEPRWRVYIPTECIMPATLYGLVVKRIMAALELQGFNKNGSGGKKKHGFDPSKVSASDIMYLPCQSLDPTGTFFLEYRGPSRSALDPRFWVNFDEQPDCFDDFLPPYQPEIIGNNANIQSDIDEWRLSDRPELRNKAWAHLYFGLVKKRIPCETIKEVMTAEAHLCKTPKQTKDRLRELHDMQQRGNLK